MAASPRIPISHPRSRRDEIAARQPGRTTVSSGSPLAASFSHCPRADACVHRFERRAGMRRYGYWIMAGVLVGFVGAAGQAAAQTDSGTTPAPATSSKGKKTTKRNPATESDDSNLKPGAAQPSAGASATQSD